MLKQEEAYNIVTKYMEDNPGATLNQALQATRQLPGNYYKWKQKLDRKHAPPPSEKKEPKLLCFYGDVEEIAHFLKTKIVGN